MKDRFGSYAPGLEAPASHGFAITPDDGQDLGEVTRAIFAGSAGAVAVVMVSGAEIVFTGVAAGSVLPIRVTKVRATGTTALGLVGLS